MEQIGKHKQTHKLIDNILFWRHLVQDIYEDVEHLGQVFENDERQDDFNGWVYWTWHQVAKSIAGVIIFHKLKELFPMCLCFEYFFG